MKPILPLILFVICIAPATAAETNPAEAYRRAFALLEKLDDADGQRLGLCGKDGCWVVTTPLDAASDRLLASQLEAVGLARSASKMAGVRWDLDGDAGRMIELSNRGPRLSALLVLQARKSLKQGRADLAVDDLLAALTLSRHLAAEPTIVTKMAELAAARPAVELLARELPTLPKELVAALPERLTKLPQSPGLDAIIRGEYAFAKRTVVSQGVFAVAMVDALEDFYALLADNATKPADEFAKLVDAQVAKLPLNPFAKILGPQFKRQQETCLMFDAKHAMTLTAIDVVLNGPQAVAASKDPADGKPFELRPRDKGFELVSRVTNRGAAATLVVGE